jgi:hypothetical protein
MAKDNNSSSIFMTHHENPYSCDNTSIDIVTISKLKLDAMIPAAAYTEPINDLLKVCTEWRWRIFKFPQSNNIEISKKAPNEERLFKTKFDEWVHFEYDNFDEKYKKYLLISYYYYT